MVNKILISFLILSKLAASSMNHQDLYNKLSYPNMITFRGASDDFKLHNINALTPFIQAPNVKGLKPYDVFKKSIHLQSLSTDVKEKFLSLPNIPQEIKETTDNLCVHVFAFALEAFEKEEDPLFIYATWPAKADDVITSLCMDDFNYADALTQYRQTCSQLKLFPFDHIEDQTQRLNCLKDLADIGIIEAQLICACILYNQDKEQAFHYFMMAADQEDASAQFNCGSMLYVGNGIPQDKAQAFRYFMMAADQKDATAQFNCGDMLYNGDGIPQDKAQAFRYFMMAANKEHTLALFNCGVMLYKGDGVPEDKEKAFHYLMMAAAQKHTLAQFHCGVMLYNGDGVPEDKEEAFRYFKIAAEQGYKEAQFHCGDMLHNGDGVSKNVSQALEYYKLAAEQGDQNAQFQCGMILSRDQRVPIDLVEAFKYFKMAAEQGHREAEINCSIILSSDVRGLTR